MLKKLVVPMNYKLTLFHFGIFTAALLLLTWFLDKGVAWYANIIFTMLCGTIDYLLLYGSITKALKESPEMSLLVMRKGTFIRFGVILILGFVVKYIEILNIATVLLGLVITQVMLILDSIIISLREQKNANEKGGKI